MFSLFEIIIFDKVMGLFQLVCFLRMNGACGDVPMKLASDTRVWCFVPLRRNFFFL
jgi:hypothetical protein